MAKAAKQINLMVVDDSTTMRKLIAGHAVKNPNVKVVAEASNAHDAISYFKKNKQLGINLVTMDITMPDRMGTNMDGVEAIKQLKALDPDVPIIVITALNDQKLAMAAILAGGDSIITKPISEDDVLGAIADVGF